MSTIVPNGWADYGKKRKPCNEKHQSKKLLSDSMICVCVSVCALISQYSLVELVLEPFQCQRLITTGFHGKDLL